MKKIFPLIILMIMLLVTASCGRAVSSEEQSPEPETVKVISAPEPDKAKIAELPVEAAYDDEQSAENESVSDVPAPASAAPESSMDSTPAKAPAPAPAHSHSWIEISETVHHDAVTEQRKVVDQEGAEGHYEGGSYSVVVCRCGAEFSSAAAFLSHQRSAEDIEQHGGYTTSVRSAQVWIEGTPEVFHYETKTVKEAWDEEVITGYICEGCGASK